MKTIPIQPIAPNISLKREEINTWFFCLNKFLRENYKEAHAIQEHPMIDGTLIISLWEIDGSIYLHPQNDEYFFFSDDEIDELQLEQIELIVNKSFLQINANECIEFSWHVFVKIGYTNSSIKLLDKSANLEGGITLHPAGALAYMDKLVKVDTLTEAINYPSSKKKFANNSYIGHGTHLGLCAISSSASAVSWDMALVDIHLLTERLVEYLSLVFDCPVSLHGSVNRSGFESDVDYLLGDNSLEAMCKPEYISIDGDEKELWKMFLTDNLLNDTACLFNQSLHNMDLYPSLSQFGFASIIEAIGATLYPPTQCSGHDGNEAIHCEACQLKTGSRKAFLKATQLVTDEKTARTIRKRHYDFYRARFTHESQILAFSRLPHNPRHRLVIKDQKDEFTSELYRIRCVAHSVLWAYVKTGRFLAQSLNSTKGDSSIQPD